MAFQGFVHPTKGPTVKQRIMKALDDYLTTMEVESEAVWQNTYHGDLADLDNVQAPCASLDFGIEEMLNNTFPCSHYRLPVFIHFRFRGQRGVDEHDVYLYYLGLLQSAMLGDHNLGGYSYNVKEVSNAHTIIGVEDAFPGGVLIVEVDYKTRLHNPYNTPAMA